MNELFQLNRASSPHVAVQYLWQQPGLPPWSVAGVSLHGHSCYSRENLRYLESYCEAMPGLRLLLRVARWHHRLRTGNTLDLAQVFWLPPLSPEQAWQVEASQIARLGLQPLVSITDHDDITAGLETPAAQVSAEWTLPWGGTMLHIGVHNLPRQSALSWQRRMADVTRGAPVEDLRDLLAALHGLEGTLVVLNHPLWDECRVGTGVHAAAVGAFLAQHRDSLDALELNGLRAARENLAVMQLARAFGLPVVAGGDRHGREPGACFNLTRTSTFADFAAEVRRERRSHIVFTPAYRLSIRWRWLRVAREIMQGNGEAPGARAHWLQRFYYTAEDGLVRSLFEDWGGDASACLFPWLALVRMSGWPGSAALSRWLFQDGGDFSRLDAALSTVF